MVVTADTEREWFAAFFEYLKIAVSLTTFDVTARAISYISVAFSLWSTETTFLLVSLGVDHDFCTCRHLCHLCDL